MTIHHVELAWSKVGGAGLKSSGDKLSCAFTDGYQVTHSYDATDTEIMTATGIPRLGSRRAGTTIPCVGISPPQRMGPIFSMVTIEWFAEVAYTPGDTPETIFNKNPLLQPAEIQWENEITSESIDEDWNGNPVATTNGEPFYGVTTDIPDIVLVATKNFPSWNPKVIREYLRSTNSDTFFTPSGTFEPGEVRLKSCPASRVIDEQFGVYWRATARFHMRYPFNTTSDKAWYARVRHEGFKVRRPGSSALSDLMWGTVDGTESGERSPVPVLLTSAGFQQTDATAAEWKEFQRFGSLPFNALGFLA
jgi:hypothetical protein